MSGVIPYLVHDGLSILQYADDTILFMEHNFEQAKNMKLLLSDFEQLSRLKINFYKSDFSILGRPRIANRNMNNYLVVKKDHTRLDI
jgi:negative regulator of sigma E activity